MIGGNIVATLQKMSINNMNDIGEREVQWVDVTTINGWLDLMNGESTHSTYLSKVQESTHIFLCDYASDLIDYESKDTRLVINGNAYEILLMDNPMGMCQHLEWYLKYVGSGLGVN